MLEGLGPGGVLGAAASGASFCCCSNCCASPYLGSGRERIGCPPASVRCESAPGPDTWAGLVIGDLVVEVRAGAEADGASASRPLEKVGAVRGQLLEGFAIEV